MFFWLRGVGFVSSNLSVHGSVVLSGKKPIPSFAFCTFCLYKLQVHSLQATSLKSYIKHEDKIQRLFPKTGPQAVFQFLSSHFDSASSTNGYKILWPAQSSSGAERAQVAAAQTTLEWGTPQNLPAGCSENLVSPVQMGNTSQQHSVNVSN